MFSFCGVHGFLAMHLYFSGYFVSVKRQAGKVASEMTYKCVDWDIQPYSTPPHPRCLVPVSK